MTEQSGEKLHREHPLRDAIVEGAIAAEKAMGHHEETDEEAKHALWLRILYTLGGTIVIIIGILLLPLPGPGWVVVALGFSILPFQWSRRVVREIRRRIPGVPEDGAIPLSTWITGGVLLAVMTSISIFWGDDILSWVKGLFN